MQFYKIPTKKLTGEQINGFIDKFIADELPKIMDKEAYFRGENPFILRRNKDISTDAPDWKVRISYARKIINTVAGYLFKPGNIKYTYNTKKYSSTINEIFTRNKEVIKSSQLGKIVSTQGFGYEMFMADENQNPIWIVADVKEIIPFYTDDLDSKLYAFIRFIEVIEGKETVKYVDVYYPDVIEHWKISTDDQGKAVVNKIEEDTPNIYIASGKPPLVVYKNNEELIGDFETVINKDGQGGLIDGHDVMCSDGLNEEDRFAWAYLLMSDDIRKSDADKVKQQRIFANLNKDGFVKFLTKDIPTNFFQFMQNWLKNEIHRQTHIPDFLDMSGGPLTGAALDRLLYDFEFLCATKETYFKDGLYNRILMLDSLRNITDAEFVSEDIEIVMQRNRPADNLANAQIVQAYKASGLPIEDKTLMENFCPFVKDVDEEIAQYEEKAQAEIELFAEQQMFNLEENNNDQVREGTGTNQ